MILNPGQHFTVVRQLQNHMDSATYYVRAVIRNAFTDEIIDTLSLTDKGGQRFKSDWLVANDPLGLGYYISVVTSVYTDSGYTSKSENYGDEETTYLVQDRIMHGGGGGTTLDYGAVRKIVQDEIAKIDIPTPPRVTMPEMRWNEIFAAIAELHDAVDKIPTTTPNLQPILSAIRSVEGAINAKEVTPETDTLPVIQAVQTVGDDMSVTHEQTMRVMESVEASISQKIESLRASLDEKIPELIGGMKFNLEVNKPKKQEPIPFDINQLVA